MFARLLLVALSVLGAERAGAGEAGLTVPGTAHYPGGGMRLLGVGTGVSADYAVEESVLDPDTGHLYAITSDRMSRVIKLTTGEGTELPQVVSSVDVPDPRPKGLLIDAASDHLYFATYSNPAMLVKLKLGAGDEAPVRLGKATFPLGEGFTSAAMIDTAHGYAYVLTDSNTKFLVKVALGAGDAPPTRVGSVALTSTAVAALPHFASTGLVGAVDPVGGYAYLATRTYPASVIKVALGEGDALPVELGGVTFNAGENSARSLAIDPASGYGYVGLDSGNVTKFALGAGGALPTRVGTVTLGAGNESFAIAGLDTAHGQGYWVSHSTVYKTSLGAGIALPSPLGTAALTGAESIAIDVAKGQAYLPTNSVHYEEYWHQPSAIAKLALGAGDAAPVVLGSQTLRAGEGEWRYESAHFDPTNRTGFFTTKTGQIVKTALATDTTSDTMVGTLKIDPNVSNFLPASALDTAAGYGYFGVQVNRYYPSRVIKVRLGDRTTPPTRVASVDLPAEEQQFVAAALDSTKRSLLLGTVSTNPQKLVKVFTGIGDAAPVRIGSIPLEVGEVYRGNPVVDPTTHHAYFPATITSGSTTTGRVIMFAVNDAATLPTRMGSVDLLPEDGPPLAMVIDPGRRRAVIASGNGWNSLRIVKITLDRGDAAPVLAGSITVPTDEPYSRVSADINPGKWYACFARTSDFSDTIHVTKIGLGGWDEEPWFLGDLPVVPHPGHGQYGSPMFLDPVAEVLHMGTAEYYAPSRRLRIAIPNRLGAINGTKFTLTERATSVDTVKLYTHAVVGYIRLALYDNAEPKNLLWQSDVVPNLGQPVPISAGTPASLSLPPGTYWAAWQTDSEEPIGSYTAGSLGDGFTLNQAFGPAPATLPAEKVVVTDERWTESIGYTTASGLAGWVVF